MPASGGQFAAKHECMNEKTQRPPATNEALIRLPAYPYSGRELFGDLLHRLGRAFDPKLTVRRLSNLLGVPRSTVHYWLVAYPHPQVISFMGLLERLSPAEKHAFIDEHTRMLPAFGNLVDSASSRPGLPVLLKKKSGVTLVGGPEVSRRCVLAAVGNYYQATETRRRNISGIDLHRPNDLVPVEGVFYIDAAVGMENARTTVNKIWSRLCTSKAPLVLFNGVWSALPERRVDIIRLSRTRHVLMADGKLPGPGDLNRVGGEVHLLTASKLNDEKIHVTVRPLK